MPPGMRFWRSRFWRSFLQHGTLAGTLWAQSELSAYNVLQAGFELTADGESTFGRFLASQSDLLLAMAT